MHSVAAFPQDALQRDETQTRQDRLIGDEEIALAFDHFDIDGDGRCSAFASCAAIEGRRRNSIENQ